MWALDLTLLFSPEFAVRTVICLITFLFMIVLAGIIIKNDICKMKIKMWRLLLFIGVGFLGYLIARIASGTFEWYDLLVIPIYAVLNILNTLFCRNRFIGQADVDILSGSFAMYIPAIIRTMSVDYGNTVVNSIHMMDLIKFGLEFLLAGYILAIAVAGIRFVLAKRRDKKLDNNDIKELTDKNNKRKNNKKLKEKIPIAMSFMPLFFYCVYMGIFL